MDYDKRLIDISVKEYIEMERGPLWAVSWGQSLLQAGVLALCAWLFMRIKKRRDLFKAPKLAADPPIPQKIDVWYWDFYGSECRKCAAKMTDPGRFDACPECGFKG